jgi:hypothetical protein
MSTSFTANLKLGEPAIADTGWGPIINTDFTTLDALTPVGHLAVTPHEAPTSTSLTVDVSAGFFIRQDGTPQSYAGVTGFAIPSNTTKVLYLDGTASWALTIAAAYPATAHVRLATVVAAAFVITSITDNRKCFPVCGSMAEGANLTLGTTTGTQIGTASSQKLGFFGKTPIVQPTMGAATAGGTYTATEQTMLQTVYNAVRNLGLGS